MKDEFEIVVIGQLTLDDVVLFDQPALLDSPGGSGLYALAGVCFWETGPLGFVTRRGPAEADRQGPQGCQWAHQRFRRGSRAARIETDHPSLEDDQARVGSATSP